VKGPADDPRTIERERTYKEGVGRMISAKASCAALVAAVTAAAVTTTSAVAGPYSNIAAAMVRQAAPTVEAYWVDHHTYVGLSVAKLRLIDPNTSSIEIAYAHSGTYCIQASVLGSWYHVARVGSAPKATVAGPSRCPHG
jgi:hypothetical protein